MKSIKKEHNRHSISRKKATQLYDSVYNNVMDARVKISMLQQKDVNTRQLQNEINEIMAELCFTAPQLAIDIFKINKK